MKRKKYMNDGGMIISMELVKQRVDWVKYFYILGMLAGLLLILNGIGVL